MTFGRRRMAVDRRQALALLGAAVSSACAAACDPAKPPLAAPNVAPGAEPPLELDPIVGIVPAAGLKWLIEARARELLASPALIPAVALLLPEARFDAFAMHYGGVDLREVKDLAVAAYPEATLALARVPIEPGRVEAAFSARAVTVEGRAASRGVTRLWGSVGQDREQIAIFGRDAVGLEHGHLGPLRAAIYFAERRLARAAPALAAEPLNEAARAIGSAPLRAFAPGPFEERLVAGPRRAPESHDGRSLAAVWPAMLDGAARPGPSNGAAAGNDAPAERSSSALRLALLLTGAWGSDAAAAGQRLKAAFDVLASDPLGRLSGVDHPLEAARVTTADGALRLDVTLDAMALARGLYNATTATIGEVMAY